MISEKVITAARAVYDSTAADVSSRFAGVISVDISYEHIKQVSLSNRKLLLEKLKKILHNMLS